MLHRTAGHERTAPTGSAETGAAFLPDFTRAVFAIVLIASLLAFVLRWRARTLPRSSPTSPGQLPLWTGLLCAAVFARRGPARRLPLRRRACMMVTVAAVGIVSWFGRGPCLGVRPLLPNGTGRSCADLSLRDRRRAVALRYFTSRTSGRPTSRPRRRAACGRCRRASARTSCSTA
jgi:hypothetical protein